MEKFEIPNTGDDIVMFVIIIIVALVIGAGLIYFNHRGSDVNDEEIEKKKIEKKIEKKMEKASNKESKKEKNTEKK